MCCVTGKQCIYCLDFTSWPDDDVLIWAHHMIIDFYLLFRVVPGCFHVYQKRVTITQHPIFQYTWFDPDLWVYGKKWPKRTRTLPFSCVTAIFSYQCMASSHYSKTAQVVDNAGQGVLMEFWTYLALYGCVCCNIIVLTPHCFCAFLGASFYLQI